MRILDESYNSNPDSLEATLSAFAQMKGKRRGILVLGDMLELGAETERAHEEIGKRIGEIGFAYLFLLGEMANPLGRGAEAAGMNRENILMAQNHEEVLAGLRTVLQEGDWIFIKGSRKMQLERIIERLQAT